MKELDFRLFLHTIECVEVQTNRTICTITPNGAVFLDKQNVRTEYLIEIYRVCTNFDKVRNSLKNK